jgi:hypothetical protein
MYPTVIHLVLLCLVTTKVSNSRTYMSIFLPIVSDQSFGLRLSFLRGLPLNFLRSIVRVVSLQKDC